jgi:hypothetical protein
MLIVIPLAGVEKVLSGKESWCANYLEPSVMSNPAGGERNWAAVHSRVNMLKLKIASAELINKWILKKIYHFS